MKLLYNSLSTAVVIMCVNNADAGKTKASWGHGASATGLAAAVEIRKTTCTLNN